MLYTSDPPTNSESLWQQPPEEAMDTDRDVNVVSLSLLHKPEVEKMEVNSATESNTEYLHPGEPLL